MLEIDFIGYDGTHPNGFIYGLPNGHDSYLLLLTATPVEFLLADGIEGAFQDARAPLSMEERKTASFHRFPAGTAILYTPGSHVLYRACEETYVNDWIRFRCDEAFAEQLPLKNQPFQVSDAEYCHDLFKLMTWESTLGNSESQGVLSHLLKALFFKLAESCFRPASNPHMQEMYDLHRRIYNHPELPWNVDSMARDLHLSSGYLQALYKTMFGSSCMEDVILQRLKNAQDQLVSTSKSVREIAEDCGYNNVEHFSRQFRKFLGTSPNRYRKEHARELSLPEASPSRRSTLGGSEMENGVHLDPRY